MADRFDGLELALRRVPGVCAVTRDDDAPWPSVQVHLTGNGVSAQLTATVRALLDRHYGPGTAELELVPADTSAASPADDLMSVSPGVARCDVRRGTDGQAVDVLVSVTDDASLSTTRRDLLSLAQVSRRTAERALVERVRGTGRAAGAVPSRRRLTRR